MKINATDALLVVDVQRDFCPGGALAVNEGDQIIPIINRLIPLFHHVVYSRDWHPENHCSFAGNPAFVDGSWPVHCVADTPGAEFHPDLDIPEDAFVISKATEAGREAYSDFDGTGLAETLRKWGVKRVYVCGLATDYCVKATALDAVEEGFDVALIEDACRGVDVPPGSVAEAVREMEEMGVAIVRSETLE